MYITTPRKKSYACLIYKVHGYLNTCSVSIHCNLGDGQVECLIITAQTATFALTCTNTFICPVNRGATLTLPDLVPTYAGIITLTRTHAKKLCTYDKFNNVDKASKNLFRLIHEAYYCLFKNKYTGFAMVSCLIIPTHLWTMYRILQDYKV